MEAVPRTASGAPIVQGDRYPVHDLKSDAGRRLVAACRQKLQADLALNLPGFCTPEVAQEMLLEIEPCRSVGLEKPRSRKNFLSEKPGEVPSDLPADHPRCQFMSVKGGLQLAYDQMPGCAVERLFQWDALADFIGLRLDQAPPFAFASRCIDARVCVRARVPDLFRRRDGLGADVPDGGSVPG